MELTTGDRGFSGSIQAHMQFLTILILFNFFSYIKIIFLGTPLYLKSKFLNYHFIDIIDNLQDILFNIFVAVIAFD